MIEITKDFIIGHVYKFTKSDSLYLETTSKIFSKFETYISQKDIDDYEFGDVYDLDDLLDPALSPCKLMLIELLCKQNYFGVEFSELSILEYLISIKGNLYLPLEVFYLKCNIGDLIITIDTYNKVVSSIDPTYAIKVIVREEEVWNE